MKVNCQFPSGWFNTQLSSSSIGNELIIDNGATISDLIALLIDQGGDVLANAFIDFKGRRKILVSVNGKIVDDSYIIAEGDVIRFIIPICGG